MSHTDLRSAIERNIEPSGPAIQRAAADAIGVSRFLHERESELNKVQQAASDVNDHIRKVTTNIEASRQEVTTRISALRDNVIRLSNLQEPGARDDLRKQLRAETEKLIQIDRAQREAIDVVQRALNGNRGFELPALDLSGVAQQLGGVNKATIDQLRGLISSRQSAEELLKKFASNTDLSSTTVASGLVQLGVDSALVNRGVQAYNTAISVKTAVAAFASGNYMQAASAVANMLGIQGIPGIGGVAGFFGGGDDGTAQQLAEISRVLGQISAQLRELDRKITLLSEQIARDHAQTMAMLELINTNAITSVRISAADLDVNLFGGCRTAQGILDYHEDDKRAAFVQQYPNSFGQCNANLGLPAVTTAMMLWGYDKKYLTIDYYRQQVVRPLLALLRDSYTPAERQALLRVLREPSESYGLLKRGLDRSGVDAVPESLSAALGEDYWFSPEAVMEYAHFVLFADAYQYRLGRDSAGLRWLSAADAGAQRTAAQATVQRQEAMKLLRKAVELLDVAIIQQSALSGDAALQGLADKLQVTERGDLSDPSVGALLYNNPVLAQNLIRHWLYEGLAGRQSPTAGLASDATMSYVIAANAVQEGITPEKLKDAGFEQFLRISLGRQLQSAVFMRFEPQEGRWYWVFSTVPLQAMGQEQKTQIVRVPLPSVSEFINREYVTTEQLQGLLSVRDRVLSRINAYEAGDKLSVPERRSLAFGVIRTVLDASDSERADLAAWLGF